MRVRFLGILPAALILAACVDEGPGGAAPQAAGAAGDMTGGMTVAERLSGSRLELTAQEGDAPPMVMQLRADGSSATSMSGFVLTGQWEVEGSTMCQTDIRLAGMPSDDQSPQCVEVSISGDRVTLVGEADDGSPETFTGTITPL